MAKRTVKKAWTDTDYYNEAREFIACYGVGYCWDEFVYEYVTTWQHDSFKCPDGDLLMAAILRAEKAHVAV
jgi:hypothetical protein